MSRKNLLLFTGVVFALISATPFIASAQINVQFLGRYSIGTYNSNGGVAEISAYDPSTKRMYVVNGPDTSFRIVNMANPANPVLISTISVKPYGIDVTSITTNKKGLVAIAVIDSNGKTNPSSIVFLDANGNFINKVKAGANTDHIIFTPDGKKLLCANEGEPNVGYTIDPEGSISIIDVSGGASSLTQANVQTAGFTAFNAPATINPNIRILGRIQSGGTFLRNSTVAEDLEPEYIAVSDDNSTAWVTCQENNALAVVNINTATVTALLPLGFKNHNLAGNGLDASDRQSSTLPGIINIRTLPVFGMYQPDGIVSYRAGSQTFLVTANEGDARADWGSANNEEVRVNNASFILDTVKFGGAAAVAAIKTDSVLGRLNVTNRWGDFNNDGRIDSIFTFGARSFSIWNATTGALVWDSKDDFEQRIAALFPSNFNAGHTTNALDDRSDNKGPEPEAVTVGRILDSTYAFVGLERIGGFFVYNITNPNNPYFVQYINTRNFSVTPSQANLATVGDLGPEGIVFIPRNESPNGKDLIMLSNEVSGTVAIYQVNSRSAYQMQILHSSDMESSVSAVVDAPNFAAVVDELEDRHTNTLILSSGDNVLPGPFLSSGEDASLQTPLRSTASSYWSGNSGQLRAAIGRPDIAIMNAIGYNASALGNHEFDLGTSELNSQIGVDIRSSGADRRWIGAQFPFVSCNLNFANDVNLSYLYTNQILSDTAFRTSPTITANSQKRGIAPSVIIERGGERIGIVGATTQVLASISSPGATTIIGPTTDNMPALAAIIQPVVDSLRSLGINKIILLSHLQQIANEKALAPLLRHVDIIISGGNHAFTADGNDRLTPGHVATERYPILTTNNNGQPLAILNTTSEWKYVGRFVCDFDTAGVLLPNLLDSTINGAYVADTAMVTSLWGSYAAAFATGTKGANVRTLCNAVGSVITAKDGNKFGRSNVFLEGRRNFVRTEETNFGNLTSDANLWYAKQYDPQVRISIKNGGGIRSAIGYVNAVGSNVTLEQTLANPSANKNRGDVSQLDIENSLRFNNGLVIGTVNAAGLRRILEHGISATVPGATPGQFPQVGGVQFSYDTTRPRGSEILSLVVTDSAGNRLDTIVRNGLLVGDTTRTFKLVTLNFLFTGGDSYPFPANATNRVNLDTAIKNTGIATFAAIGSEQDAFAEYMGTFHTATPFNVRDTSLIGDRKIQLLNARPDAIFPETNPAVSIQQARNIAAPNLVRIRGVITRAWGRFIYVQDATAAIGVRQSSGAMVDSIVTGGLRAGDSVEVIANRNDFNNYAQIQLVSGAYTPTNTIIKLATNRPLPAAQTITVKQFLANPESFESELVRIVNLRTGSTGNFAASTNYTVWDGTTTGDTTVLRVIAAADTEIDDAPALAIPSGLFTFEGTVIQFCSSPASGCATGYQLQGVRKSEIIPQLGAFNLVGPASGTRLVTSSGNANNVVINWTRSSNAIRYRWYLDVPAGSFNPGLYSQLSNNNGADTLLTLTVSQIDALLGSLGVQQGDSINVKWTVKSFTASDSLNAAQSFNLLLVRQAPAPQLGAFNLLSPANNARLVISSANPGSAVINWTRSTNAIRYRWYLDVPAGNFNPGLYSQLSNNSGADTALTLTIAQIDALLGTLGVQRGDSITVKWTVKSFTTTDSLTATQSFNLKLVRERILVAFSLTSPANNSRVVAESGNTTPVSITWGNGQAVSYKWMATLLTGNFSNPLLVLPSDAAGTATALTLTSGVLHATLGTLGVKLGDSVTVRWTVFGYRGVDSLKASNDFVLNLVRKRNLGTFGLLSPADNARIAVKDNDTNKVVITWQTSAAATKYKWMIDLPTGNFANPIASLLSDNSGTATTLTLSSGAISTLLGNAGVAKGDSINLKWTVRALETNVDSILANTSFQLKTVRLKDVNIGLAKQLGKGIHLYPNPVTDKLHVSNELGISVSYTLFDVNGKALRSGVCDNEMIIDMSEYANGIYLIVLANGDAKTHHKLIKNQ